MGLDLVDKRIIVELLYNGRLSYRTLAHHLGLTIKSIRKRVIKLIEKGIIKRFVMALNRTALGSNSEVNLVLGQFWTNGTEQDDALIQQIGNHNTVYRVFKTTRDNYGFYALIIGFQGLSDLTEFVQGLNAVTKVETDTLIFHQSPGLWPELTNWHLPKVRNLTKDQWQVVLHLKADSRMPITEVARRTRQPVRRVRKTINLLIETRYVVATIRWDPAAAGHVQAFLRTDLDLKQITPEDFVNWLYEKYPCECWGAYSVADAPATIIQDVSAPTIHKIDEMQKLVKGAPFTENVEALVTFRQHRFDGLAEHYLDERLTNAGL